MSITLVLFLIVVGITLVITAWAARRTRTTVQFWAAGRTIKGWQNGLAIAGDYMSAASFPGHRRPDRVQRLRRLHVLRGLVGRIPDRALPDRGADAEHRQVHDGRRPFLPDVASA